MRPAPRLAARNRETQSRRVTAKREDQGAIMNNTAIRRAVTRLISAMLLVAQTSAFTQVRSAAQERSQVAQFCVPPEPDADAHRFYCRNGDG